MVSLRRGRRRAAAWTCYTAAAFSMLLRLAAPASAHEVGAPFSGAIIDPLVVHHAHLENEQRLNFFSLRGVEGARGRKRFALEGEMEMAWASDDFRFGAEVFVPFASVPEPDGSSRSAGLGDLALRPVKFALVNRPDVVVTTGPELLLPTGDEDDGLGAGNTTFTQFLFVDKAFANWFGGLNLGPNVNVAGERGAGMEIGAVASYSFIRGGTSEAVVEPLPRQPLVLSPSLEFLTEVRFDGPAAGDHATALLPGLTLWWTRSGWQAHAGVQFPVSGEREADQTFLLQVGNHLNWRTLLSR